MVNDYRRMTPQQREADRERRRIGRERRAAEKEANKLNAVYDTGKRHILKVDVAMRTEWRAGYHHQSKDFPDLREQTAGHLDGSREADSAWRYTQAGWSAAPELEVSLADLLENAPVRRLRGKRKGKHVAPVDDGFSVLGSEIETEIWSDMDEQELALILNALDEKVEEEEWEIWEDSHTPAAQALGSTSRQGIQGQGVVV